MSPEKRPSQPTAFGLISGGYASWGWVCHSCSEREIGTFHNTHNARLAATAHVRAKHGKGSWSVGEPT